MYHLALERPADQQGAFLAEVCRGDEKMHREIQSLLDQCGSDTELLDRPAWELADEFLPNVWRPSLAPGVRLGPYQIQAQLGRGGMGEVYRAQDTRLNRPVAIKVLAREIHDGPAGRRFQQEAKSASALNHPNIVTIYDIGFYDSKSYIVMELVEGRSLRQILSQGAVTTTNVISIGLQIANGLAAAHGKGIVHRDLKPENILVTHEGLAKIVDFGLAKLERTGGAGMQSQMATLTVPFTSIGTILGTAGYMSPQQASGEAVDFRADQFALGAVLYEMSTGKQAFKRQTTVETLAAIITEQPVPVGQLNPQVPVALQRIIERCLAKDPAGRYSSTSELAIALAAVRENASDSPDVKSPVQADRIAELSRILPQPETGSWHRRRRNLLLIPALILVAVLITFWYRMQFGALHSLAVLPLSNVSGNASIDFLSDGISESILNSASQIRTLKVMSRSSSFRFRNPNVDVQEVGKKLGVSALLTGRLMQRDQEFVLQVELVNVRSNQQIWGRQYTTRLAGLPSVQDQIAQDVTENLRLSLGVEERRLITRRFTENTEAWQFYLKGRYFWNKRTQEGLREGIRNFEQAVALDPHYALAYAGLADCYSLQSGLIAPREVFPKAEAVAIKALEIDENLAEAHTALGFVKFHYRWDWLDSEREFKRAIQLNANYPAAHSYYARYLNAMGRFSEAIQQMRAAQDLDPLALGINTGLGQSYYFQRDFDQAIQTFEKTLVLEPKFNMARFNLAAALLQRRLVQRSIAEYETAVRADPNDAGTLCELGQAYAIAGRVDDSRHVLGQVLAMTAKRYISQPFVALIYAGLGEKDAAFDRLEKGFQDRAWSMVFLKVDPKYDSLRQDPRFNDLIRRVGLSD